MYLEIGEHEIARFAHGHEAEKILRWLEAHNAPEERLSEALDAIGRTDLADDLRAGRSVDMPGGVAGTVARSRARLAISVAVAAVVLVALAATLWIWFGDDYPESGAAVTPSDRYSSGAPCTGSASCTPFPQVTGSATSGVFEARIYQTMDVNTNAFVGVISYSDPTESGRGTDVGHYQENGTVFVVCMLREGREITDLPWRDRPLSTRVWYKLTVPGPQWVPDMYVRLLPRPGQTEPPVPPDCGG